MMPATSTATSPVRAVTRAIIASGIVRMTQSTTYARKRIQKPPWFMLSPSWRPRLQGIDFSIQPGMHHRGVRRLTLAAAPPDPAPRQDRRHGRVRTEASASYASPTEPTEGCSPASRQRHPRSSEVVWQPRSECGMARWARCRDLRLGQRSARGGNTEAAHELTQDDCSGHHVPSHGERRSAH
jgi:hypothetical protein